MENEILQQILNKLDNLVQGQSKLEQGQSKLEQGQSKLEQGQSKLEQGQLKLEQEVQSLKEITLRMEHDHGEKLQALFDGYAGNYEKIEQYEPRIAKLEAIVERLSIELRFLKASK